MKGIFLGTGQFAAVQLDAWKGVPNATIAGICGRTEAAHLLAERFSLPHAGSDFERVLTATRPDFADICNAVESHVDSLRACADAGLPILCQKPLAASLAEARDCVEYCQAAGVRLMVHDNWRWQPWYREVKRLLQSGILGELKSVYHTLRTGDGTGPTPYTEQPYFRDMPRFLLLETAIHYLDTYRFLFGEPDRLACTTHRNNPVIAGEDQAVLTLHFSSGLIVIWDGNRALPTVQRRPPFNGTMRLEGSEATLDIDVFGNMQIRTAQGSVHAHAYDLPSGYRGGSVTAALRHFVDCLQTGAPFETSGADYLKTTELVFLAYEAAASGQPILLTP